MKVAYLDPFSGASGDMLLGAVVDAGAPLEGIVEILQGLRVDGWAVRADAVTRGGLAATSVIVMCEETGVVRTWGNIRELLGGADLPEPVRRRALATFSHIAEVEARIHRRDLEHVHFHEVGGLDAIVDVVGVCAGLHLLGVESVTSGPVAQGVGMVRTDHGLLPIPAPAVLELLQGAPTYSTGEAFELCTPTGAALLAEWTDTWGALPAMTLERVGYGAGSHDLDRPNVIRIVVGEATETGPATGRALLLETTVDDLSGELVPPVLDALRTAGASDAWARPVSMKKGRPGVEIVCLASPERGEALRRVLFRETTTLGVRGTLVEKWSLDREWVEVDVVGCRVRVKLGRLHGSVMNAAPEFEDCVAASRASGLPLKEVFALASAAWVERAAAEHQRTRRPAPQPSPLPANPA